MMLSRLLGILLLLGAMFAACTNSGRDYSRWADIPSAGWAYADAVSLLPIDTTIVDNDSLVTAAVKVALRHGNDYAYSNLWVEMAYVSEQNLAVCDTVNIRLADVYGRWLGSGFGASYQREVTVEPTAVVDVTRPVVVRHIMRVDTLRGIEQIGIEIAPSRVGASD